MHHLRPHPQAPHRHWGHCSQGRHRKIYHICENFLARQVSHITQCCALITTNCWLVMSEEIELLGGWTKQPSMGSTGVSLSPSATVLPTGTTPWPCHGCGTLSWWVLAGTQSSWSNSKFCPLANGQALWFSCDMKQLYGGKFYDHTEKNVILIWWIFTHPMWWYWAARW